MSNKDKTTSRPALTSDARTKQLIALSVDEAERQIREGKASSQVITHFLKLGATERKREIELEILEKQKELIIAKTESIKAENDIKELYENAIQAMMLYSGRDNNE